MLVKIGKPLMALIWLGMFAAIAFAQPPSPKYFLFAAIGIAILHSLQFITIRKALREAGILQKGDALQVVIFGFFALWQIRSRLETKTTEGDS
ncbi:DUF1145 domain-containing protein [Alginatibacterium sediminis]|uniref:DUF1145 domain-containing protein n=1 Tax=Alginatibacterium sediminis TaxID=2164068 RepID=A0A420ELM9_9ALTE|nr:DUF1145 domain-containing protein [Alginatibacterium sediminis]RKF21504.1 DUF1145 domain-containing protein [Alginatibacterium sediminis]